MATYATYRHIELDKVGYSKKRVRNPPTEIVSALTTPKSSAGKSAVDGNVTPRRRSTTMSSNDSFSRLFGESPEKAHTPRRASLTKHDVTNRNPVTGNGVQSWDSRPGSRNTSRIHTERNPVTGEYYTIISPASTPIKLTNGNGNFANKLAAVTNGNHELPAGLTTNGQA